jgi:regulator of cell morphogenesis and NO signaling
MGSSKGKNTINFNEMGLDKLLHYLSDTHDSIIKGAVSRFKVYIKTITKVDGDIHPEVKKISVLIQELTALIEQHLILEEHLLFPYIETMIKTNGALPQLEPNLSENPLKKIKAEHNKIITILKKIRIISNDYLPGVNSSPALKLCYAQLFDFEQDIHRHIFLEEKILFPKLVEIEKRNNTTKETETKAFGNNIRKNK